MRQGIEENVETSYEYIKGDMEMRVKIIIETPNMKVYFGRERRAW
jgi:hypothetical protein